MRMYSATRLLFLVLIHLLLLFHGSPTEAIRNETRTANLNLGAIIGTNSRKGKEEKTAMEIAIQSFNNSSNQYKLDLHVNDSGGDPLRTVSAAEDFITKQKVEALLGMETWQEAALVAEVGKRAEVPVFSFASASVAASVTAQQWPFLVRMTNDETTQMKCVAAVVGAYKWRNVITIYEDDTYGSNSGMVTFLSEALQDVGSWIEHRMIFPPVSSISDPVDEILTELGKLNSKQSRVFILVQPSVSFSVHLFTQAKKIGLMGKESVWITTNSIASVLDSFNSSIISSMQGVLGIKTYFSENSLSFKDFSYKFKRNFRSEYPEEEHFEPGIYAVRAYDAISTLTQAMEKSINNGTSKEFLDRILSSNFSGLSGIVQFENGELSNSLVFQVVNVAGKSYKELDFWTAECGFSESLVGDQCNGADYNIEGLKGAVDWPGGLQRAPKGSEWPNDLKPLKIGVPELSVFDEFIKVEKNKNPNLPPLVTAKGFCVAVFEEAVEILRQTKYAIPYEFESYRGPYDDLVDKVYRKEYDAVVGDITILSNRSEKVEFTQPYTESGLSLVVPVKKESGGWIFMKPFKITMWLLSGLVLLYTMLVIWFLEHQSRNKAFTGPRKDQLATALWFTFSTLFFAHREPLKSKSTRFVMVIWLFVVLILSSSYTANLTSMLTVQQLKPTVSEIEQLKSSNSIVGCDNDSFVYGFLVETLGFKEGNIMKITDEESYVAEFEKGNIKAAFLETPGEKVFHSKYCNKYTTANETIRRFPGWGFVFPSGSALAADFSTAILELLENGKIAELEEDWLSGDKKCSKSGTEVGNGSLGPDSFWGLFVVTGGVSTITFLLFLINQWRKHRNSRTRWHRAKDLLHQKGQRHYSVMGDPASAQSIASNGDFKHLGEYNEPKYHQVSRMAEIEIQNTSVTNV